jgi:cytochrome P450
MAENADQPTPGEINLFSFDFAAAPQPAFREAMSRCPVARSALIGLPIICKYEDVLWALRHPEIFSSELDMQIALGTQRPMIPQQIDPPLQTKFRKILDLRFNRQRMAELEPSVRRHANELIDAIIDKGECEYDRDYAVPLPCTAFLGLMGLPIEDLPFCLEVKDGVIRPGVSPEEIFRAAALRQQTGQRIYDYFEGVIEQRLSNPGDDIVSYLTTAEIDGRKLTRNEMLDICYLFLLGGLDTVTATLGCSTAYLAANPAHRKRLSAQPEIIPAAIEELLRWETPVMGLPRVVKQTVTIGGVEIPEGMIVTLMVGAANIDDAEFGDGCKVDFDRPANRHLAFGAGAHRCLGSHLARMELRVGLEEWHRRIPDYAIKPGESPRYTPGIREVRYLPLVWGDKMPAQEAA